jgi:hypothetical protein
VPDAVDAIGATDGIAAGEDDGEVACVTVLEGMARSPPFVSSVSDFDLLIYANLSVKNMVYSVSNGSV